jgi:DNA-binding transcriptional LysR family regulator
VAELEARLGVTLVARTTRRASLTEAGERVLIRALRIVEQAEAAYEEAGDARAGLRGRLRISAPLSFSLLYLSPILPDFLRAYPEIVVDLDLQDRTVDLIGDGFDAAVRIRALEDSSLVARPLAPVRPHLVGAPSYFALRGRPERPEDLRGHHCFLYANLAAGGLWRFTAPGGEAVAVRIEPRLQYNNGDIVGTSVRAGLGLALQPDFLCWEDLCAGRIEAAMCDWRAPEAMLHVLTPAARAQSAKLRAFSDFMHDHFGGGRAPWLAYRS